MLNIFSYLSKRNKYFQREMNEKKELKRILWHKSTFYVEDQNNKAEKYSTRLKDFVMNVLF